MKREIEKSLQLKVSHKEIKAALRPLQQISSTTVRGGIPARNGKPTIMANRSDYTVAKPETVCVYRGDHHRHKHNHKQLRSDKHNHKQRRKGMSDCGDGAAPESDLTAAKPQKVSTELKRLGAGVGGAVGVLPPKT